MGHVTVCAEDPEEALEIAMRIRADLGVGGESGRASPGVERASSSP
jgi:hypothetical protein